MKKQLESDQPAISTQHRTLGADALTQVRGGEYAKKHIGGVKYEDIVIKTS